MLEASSLGAKTFAVCTVLLYVKFVVTARLQAVSQFEAGGRPPEDNKLAELAKRKGPNQNYGLMIEVQADDKEDTDARQLREAKLIASERWKRIVANDVESIPLALLVFGAGLVVESHELVQVVATIAYTVARFAHTVAYAKGIQPHRSLIWVLSVLILLVAAVNIIVSVIAK